MKIFKKNNSVILIPNKAIVITMVSLHNRDVCTKKYTICFFQQLKAINYYWKKKKETCILTACHEVIAKIFTLCIISLYVCKFYINRKFLFCPYFSNDIYGNVPSKKKKMEIFLFRWKKTKKFNFLQLVFWPITNVESSQLVQ